MPASQQRLKQNIFVRFQTFFSVCIFPWLRPFQDFPPPSQSNSPTDKENEKKEKERKLFLKKLPTSGNPMYVRTTKLLCVRILSRQAPNPMSSHKGVRDREGAAVSLTLSSLISGKHSLFFLLAGNRFPNVWTSNKDFFLISTYCTTSSTNNEFGQSFSVKKARL